MTVDDLHELPTIKLLTPKEVRFLEEYIRTEGDWHDAIATVYPSPHKRNAIMTSNRLMRRPFVMQIIRQIDGTHIPTKQELIAEGWTAALSSEGSAKVSALVFTAKLTGHLKDDSPSDAKSLQDRIKEYENAHKRSEG